MVQREARSFPLCQARQKAARTSRTEYTDHTPTSKSVRVEGRRLHAPEVPFDCQEYNPKVDHRSFRAAAHIEVPE